MSERCCKNCMHFAVKLDSAGKRVVRMDYTYDCQAPIKLTLLPESVLRYPGFKWPPNRKSMTGEDGTKCASFALYQGKE